MGCCFSKNQDFNNTPPLRFPVSTHHPVKPPLPPVIEVEEESVKEVLSETPKPKPKPISDDNIPIVSPSISKEVERVGEILETTSKEQTRNGEDKTPTPTPTPTSTSAFPNERKVEKSGGFEEFSEVSEICSLSESISTTTITEIREDEDGEVQQRVYRSPAKLARKRSIPGEFVGRHERGSKSPARRFNNNPSPCRRNDNVSETVRRRIPENNKVRREPGERSGRRSRSPATRVNSGTTRQGMGRSPSRKAPRSPARIPAVAPENGRGVVEGDNSTNESIENPLVSLECFIFV